MWRGSQNSKSRIRDPFTKPFDLIFIFWLELLVLNLHAKLEVSSFNRSWDMEGVPKFYKQVMWPIHDPLWPKFHFFRRNLSWSVYMNNLPRVIREKCHSWSQTHYPQLTLCLYLFIFIFTMLMGQVCTQEEVIKTTRALSICLKYYVLHNVFVSQTNILNYTWLE